METFERHFNAADLDSRATLYGDGRVFVPAPGTPLGDPGQIRGALTQFMVSGVPIRLTVRQIYQGANTAPIVSDWGMKREAVDDSAVDMTGTGADVVRRQRDGSWAYVIDNPFGVALAAA